MLDSSPTLLNVSMPELDWRWWIPQNQGSVFFFLVWFISCLVPRYYNRAPSNLILVSWFLLSSIVLLGSSSALLVFSERILVWFISVVGSNLTSRNFFQVQVYYTSSSHHEENEQYYTTIMQPIESRTGGGDPDRDILGISVGDHQNGAKWTILHHEQNEKHSLLRFQRLTGGTISNARHTLPGPLSHKNKLGISEAALFFDLSD